MEGKRASTEALDMPTGGCLSKRRLERPQEFDQLAQSRAGRRSEEPSPRTLPLGFPNLDDCLQSGGAPAGGELHGKFFKNISLGHLTLHQEANIGFVIFNSLSTNRSNKFYPKS